MPSFVAVEERWGVPAQAEAIHTTVDIPSTLVSGEELVKSYVYQVHRDAENACQVLRVTAEAKLSPVERELNSTLRKERRGTRRSIIAADWKQSAEFAVEAYRRGHLFVFVDEEQISPRVAAVVVPANAVVRFVQVVPLVGG